MSHSLFHISVCEIFSCLSFTVLVHDRSENAQRHLLPCSPPLCFVPPCEPAWSLKSLLVTWCLLSIAPFPHDTGALVTVAALISTIYLGCSYGLGMLAKKLRSNDSELPKAY